MIRRYAATSPIRTFAGLRHKHHAWWLGLGETAVRDATITASGADGLRLAVASLGPGSQIVVPGYTCDRVIGAVVSAGARPVLVDIDPATGGFRESDLRHAIDTGADAVVLTHLFGVAPDYDRVIELALQRGVPVIEDSALIIGAAAEVRSATIAVYSFGRGKPLPLGGGGALIVRNDCPGSPDRLPGSVAHESARYGILRHVSGVIRDSSLALTIGMALSRWLSVTDREQANAPYPAGWKHRRPTRTAERSLQHGVAYARVSALAAEVGATLVRYRNAFDELGVQVAGRPGWRLPHGVAAPVLALTSPQRDDIVFRMRSAGIDCPNYWRYSIAERMGLQGLHGAEQLARDLFFLPLHNQVTRKVARDVARLLKGHELVAFN